MREIIVRVMCMATVMWDIFIAIDKLHKAELDGLVPLALGIMLFYKVLS